MKQSSDCFSLYSGNLLHYSSNIICLGICYFKTC